MTDHDISKLPKWARNDIERLRSDLAYAHRRLDVGPEGSNVFAEPYSEHPRPLGKNADIEFRISDSWHDKIRIKFTDRGDGIEIQGGDTLLIQSQASNVLRVYPKGH